MSESSAKSILCPYCGAVAAAGARCPACGGVFEPLSRKATQIAMGPWYIRDPRNPFRPGCSYDVLEKMVKAGQVTEKTVLRGPTTHQFWSLAKNVPGIAHLLGQGDEPTEEQWMEVHQRNELGLRYRTAAEAERARRSLDRALRNPVLQFDASPESAPADALQARSGNESDEDDEDWRETDSLLDRALAEDLPASDTPAADGESLDFGPSASAHDAGTATAVGSAGEEADSAPALPSPMTPMVWVLILLNSVALAVIAMLGYIIYSMQ